MEKDEAVNITVLHLSRLENQQKEVDIYALFNDLGIPREIQRSVFDILFYQKYVNGPLAFRKPIVHITPKGLKLADQLKEEYYMEKDTPLNPDNTMESTLEDACEIVYQMHQNDQYNHFWSKESYQNRPKNLRAARETLIAKNILYSKTTPKGFTTTHLNPDLYNVKSYSKALSYLSEKEKSEQGKVTPQVNVNRYDNSVNVRGDGNVVSGSNGSININSNNNLTFSYKPNDSNTLMSLLSKYWWGLLIPIVVGVIVVMIEHNWFKG